MPTHARRTLVHVLCLASWTAAALGCRERPSELAASKALDAAPAASAAQASEDVLTFHGDRQRTGWNAHETVLTPANVGGGGFGAVWSSPAFDSVSIGGQVFEPHVFASPLYLDKVDVTRGSFAGQSFRTVFAATTNAFVYAVAAADLAATPAVAPGTILWKTRLGTPIQIPNFDGDLPLGVLSTPVIDAAATPPRLYVTSVDVQKRWQVFALDVTSGAVLPGWPIQISNAALASVDRNGPAVFQGAAASSQRGALNLSPDGRFLYVPFGAYNDGGVGFMVVVDTHAPSVASAFAGAPSAVAFANGGMWSAGGATVDNRGRLYATTGNSPAGSKDTPRFWGQSVLAWDTGAGGKLTLSGTYTPFNYCQMDVGDVDLAGSAPMVVPDLDPQATATPRLVAFGGKQGNVYLLDLDRLPGRLDRRPPCSADAATDASLVPPAPQPQFGRRGPLNVFGPYSEDFNNGNFAKMRTTTAYFQAADGTSFLFATGSSRATKNTTVSIPPGIARLRVVTEPGKAAFLAVDKLDADLAFLSPGSPVITSNGAASAILWTMDANVLRVHTLHGPGVPHPILYAVDASTLKPLWRTQPNELNVGGKYAVPAIARGQVYVGTDRIQAFGLRTP